MDRRDFCGGLVSLALIPNIDEKQQKSLLLTKKFKIASRFEAEGFSISTNFDMPKSEDVVNLVGEIGELREILPLNAVVQIDVKINNRVYICTIECQNVKTSWRLKEENQ